MAARSFPDASSVAELLQNNRRWAAEKTAADPGFFKRLVARQSPPYLWIGCSDSRAPAEAIVGAGPGELFVHRNIANLVPPQDANALGVLQYAVQALKVRHILVVGHYGCGGVLAALRDEGVGPIDRWLSPIRETMRDHADELAALPDEKTRHYRLCELNVRRQVDNVNANPFVREARQQGDALDVHGWCYSIENGLVTDLLAQG